MSLPASETILSVQVYLQKLCQFAFFANMGNVLFKLLAKLSEVFGGSQLAELEVFVVILKKYL